MIVEAALARSGLNLILSIFIVFINLDLIRCYGFVSLLSVITGRIQDAVLCRQTLNFFAGECLVELGIG